MFSKKQPKRRPLFAKACAHHRRMWKVFFFFATIGNIFKIINSIDEIASRHNFSCPIKALKNQAIENHNHEHCHDDELCRRSQRQQNQG
ncbi:hypothetical protein [Ligilactobacillus ceti]|nr:hypothetical protein [Ligilactobacillus ceti]